MRRKNNGNGVHKGTLREIIRLVLLNGPMTSRDLKKAIMIRSDSIKEELSKHHKVGIVLSVSGTRGGNGKHSVVSFNPMLSDLLGGLRVSETERELTTDFLSRADSEIRRVVNKASKFPSAGGDDRSRNNNAHLAESENEFHPAGGDGDLVNGNGHLSHFDGKFIPAGGDNRSHNNNGDLGGVYTSKTPTGDAVSCATGIYKEETILKRLTTRSKEIIKKNQRHRIFSSICCSETPAKLDQERLYSLCPPVEGNFLKSTVDALQERLYSLCPPVEVNSETLSNMVGRLLERLMVVSKNLLFLAVATETFPVVPTVKETPVACPPQAVEVPPPDKPKKKRKSSKKAAEVAPPPVEEGTDEEPKRKPRKSRKGESGSFPNSAIPMYEELSVQFRHPIYEGKDHQTLDMQFARDYADAIHNADTHLPFYNAFLKMSTTFEHLKESGYAIHIHKARLRADSVGARYEDYLAAIFEAYRDRYDKFEGTDRRPPKYPQPAQLYGPKAQEYYDAWMMAQVDVPYQRYDHLPEYWPENYSGKDYQINYYTKMLEAVRRLCNYRHMIPWMVIDDLVFRRIMSQKFAEDPNLNRLMPSYTYKLAPYM